VGTLIFYLYATVCVILAPEIDGLRIKLTVYRKNKACVTFMCAKAIDIKWISLGYSDRPARGMVFPSPSGFSTQTGFWKEPNKY
jgi:hypothetical protein